MRDSLVQVATLLLHNRARLNLYWPWLTHDADGVGLRGRPGRRRSNKFFAWVIVNYQQRVTAVTQRVAQRIAELGDPQDLWETIAAFGYRRWQSQWPAKAWHKFPKGHERVWRIGSEVVRKYNGDVRGIWTNQTPTEVYDRLMEMRVGPQVSRLVIGGLIEAREIRGKGDVKADVHVKRVLGRILQGAEMPENDATEATRRLYPRNPWLLDDPLYSLGKTLCTKTRLNCQKCYMRRACVFNGRRLSQAHSVRTRRRAAGRDHS